MSSVTNLSYFHGTIDIRECREILQELGDFLLRTHVKTGDKKADGEHSVVLTIAIRSDEASEKEKGAKNNSLKMECLPRLKSYIIEGDSSEVSFAVQGTTEKFATIEALCDHYVASKKPFRNGGMLIKAIGRRPWQLMLSDIEFPSPEVVLGSGSFGKVVKAKLVKKGSETVDVAVKSSKDESSIGVITDMYTEARAMRALFHPNIIHLHGVVIEKLPVLLVIEFMEGSCLLNALQKKKVPDVNRFPIVVGILYGLLYMHTRTYIHRDIAARNVMISHNCRSVKLIDFGLAKHALQIKQSEAGKLPVKWLAPEVQKTWQFSTKSDTWAFGVCIWEIYHDGAEPYLEPVSTESKPTTPSNTPGSNTAASRSKTKTMTRKRTKQDRDGKKKGERVPLVISQNLDYLPKDFVPLYERCFEKKSRKRIELAAMADEIEKKIMQTLPKMVHAELKHHVDNRPPFDPLFKVTLTMTQSITTPATPAPPAAKTPTPSNQEKADNPNDPGRRKLGKSDAGSTGSVPEKAKGVDKAKTVRRKK